jgi:type III pantothenate kinase
VGLGSPADATVAAAEGWRMLLAVDVGNSHTVIGAFAQERLARSWRLATRADATADELELALSGLLRGLDPPGRAWEAAVLGSVVPAVNTAWTEAAARRLGCPVLVAGYPTCGGLRVEVERPGEVGVDRLADAVAAWRLFGSPAIVVDCGTAIKVDAIGAGGRFLGGAIAPGVGLSYRALLAGTALLRPVELGPPPPFLGRPTPDQLRAGMVHGFAGLVDALVERVRQEMGGAERVVVTGGWAPLLVGACRSAMKPEPSLTLHGLRLIYEHWLGQPR